MKVISMEAAEFDSYARGMFDILAENMRKIAPTGEDPEEDRRIWLEAMEELLQQEGRRIVLALVDEQLVGYFQYRLHSDIFHMEEFQIRQEFQGKNGIFRAIYGFVLPQLKPAPKYAEAYANKVNEKSLGILKRLGLEIAGENKSGRSWLLRGRFENLLKWYEIEM